MTLVLLIQVRLKVKLCCIVPEFELDLDLVDASILFHFLSPA